MDTHAVPRIYRAEGAWRVLIVMVSGVMVVAGLAGAIWTVKVAHFSDSGREIQAVAMCLIDAGLGFALGVAGLASSVVLFDGAVESRGAFSRRRLELRDIAGRGTIFVGCKAIVLIPRRKTEKQMLIGLTFKPDAFFRDWMARIPEVSPAAMRQQGR